MFKKTLASLGVAAAATAGIAFLMESPASAETVPASAQITMSHARTVVRHHGTWTYDRCCDYRPYWTCHHRWYRDHHAISWRDDRWY